MAVENIICYIVKADAILLPGAIQEILYAIASESLPAVGCEFHTIQFMTELIYDYALLSFKCLAKR